MISPTLYISKTSICVRGGEDFSLKKNSFEKSHRFLIFIKKLLTPPPLACATSKYLFCLFHPQQTERKTIETGSHRSKKRKKTVQIHNSSQRDTHPPTDIDLFKDRSKNNSTITTQDTSYDKTGSHWYTDTYIEKQIQTYTDTEQMRQFNYYMFVMTYQ